MIITGNKKSWYAVYTKPRWEKKVADLMDRRGIENYCPLNKVHRQWSDRKKVVHEPLFTSYVFVRIPLREQLNVRAVDGVLNFVYWLGKPALIRDEEIDMIKRFLNEHDHVKVHRAEICINEKVRIISGPFMMLEGSVTEVKRKTVKVLLPSLGFALTAEIDKTHLQPVALYAGSFV